MTPTPQSPDPSTDGTRTYRGSSFEELLPLIRAELGDDAIVVRQREGLTGGVGGFFQKRCVEVEARRGGGVSITDGPPAGPDGGFADALKTAGEAPRDFDDAVFPELPGPDGAPLTPAAAEDLLRRATGAPPALPVEASLPEPVAGPAPLPPAPTLSPSLDRPAFDAAAAVAAVATTLPPRPARTAPAVTASVPDAPPSAPLPGELVEPVRAAATAARPEPAAAPPILDPARALVAEGEVVAAPEPEPAPLVPAASQPASLPRTPRSAQKLARALAGHGLDAHLAQDLVDGVVAHRLPFAAPNALKRLVVSELARRIPVAQVAGAGGRLIAFVGPGGAGKTTCVAAVAAAYAARGGLPVTCVAVRARDRGAQLAALLGSAPVPVHAVEDAAEAADRIAALREQTLVIVDTPGTSPRSRRGLGALAGDLGALAPDEVHLAVPATMAPEAARDLVAATGELAVSALALTHADETDRLGSVVQVAIDTRLPLSFVGDEDGLRPADPDELARALAA